MAVAVRIGNGFRRIRVFTSALACVYSSKRTVVECQERAPVGPSILPTRITEKVSCATSTPPTRGVSQTYMEHLKKKFGWIAQEVPCFGISGQKVHVLNEPIDFYETFKSMVKNTKTRIVIASLYLGTSPLEDELIQCIHDACERAKQAKTDNFEVHILLDHTRGSRGGDKSSRAMLLPLVQQYGARVQVYLYHTPDLRGWLKKLVPERFDETVGLTHMKIYLVDDDFIISGANLSDSYFTNRQDRYIHFRACPQMADYLTDLTKAVTSISFRLQSDNIATAPEQMPHPFEDSDNGEKFKAAAKKKVLSVLQKHKTTNSFESCSVKSSDSDTVDTWLFPLVQMGPFEICDDENVTKTLLCRVEENDRILLASGYFNLTEQYMDEILNESKAQYEILTASPQANGFYKAKGVSGGVPPAYTLIAKHFFDQVCSSCQDNRISMYEYYRKHWTFHCKGLWYYLPHSTLPVLTFIGSPNFGHRSVYRDLECQIAMVTTNNELQHQLKKEHERLYESSTRVTEKTFQHSDRYVPLWVRLVTPVIKHFF